MGFEPAERPKAKQVADGETEAQKAVQAALDLSTRLLELQNAYNKADDLSTEKQAALKKMTEYTEADAAEKEAKRLSPEGAALEMIEALFAELKAAKTLEQRRALWKAYPATVLQGADATYRVAHQNLGGVYGYNSNAALWPVKVKHLLVLAEFCECDVVLCTEVPHDDMGRNELISVAGKHGWDCLLSDATSDALHKECAAVLKRSSPTEGRHLHFVDTELHLASLTSFQARTHCVPLHI